QQLHPAAGDVHPVDEHAGEVRVVVEADLHPVAAATPDLDLLELHVRVGGQGALDDRVEVQGVELREHLAGGVQLGDDDARAVAAHGDLDVTAATPGEERRDDHDGRRPRDPPSHRGGTVQAGPPATDGSRGPGAWADLPDRLHPLRRVRTQWGVVAGADPAPRREVTTGTTTREGRAQDGCTAA